MGKRVCLLLMLHWVLAWVPGCLCFQSPDFAIQCLSAQNSKRVKDLKSQKTKLQQDLKKSQNALDKTRSDVKKGQLNLRYLDKEIAVRVEYIHQTERELDSLERMVDSVQAEIRVLDSVLTVKKEKYTRALRMAQAYRKVNSSLLFALSAGDIAQMYRRLRYTRQYASYERMLGEDVQVKQIALLEQQNRLLGLKSEMNRKMQVLVEERARLSRQQVEQQSQVNVLQKQAKNLQKQVNEQQAKIAALQKKIEEVVAEEIRKAEAERKRKEEEARKKAAAAATKNKQTPAQSQSSSKTQSKTSTSKGGTAASGSWLTPEEKKLNGSFVQNKGRLPVPITGEYMIRSRFGSNTSGHSNVVLNNKGIDYVGRAGARSRSIFDGEVTRVVSFGNMKIVLIRHGSYISVYTNLSSVIVRKGQKVKARDLIGTVADDGLGNYVLHFELRQERNILNPEAWIGR